ncbi:MAG: PPC domain-containing protein [Candidatus Solibacter sp.]
MSRSATPLGIAVFFGTLLAHAQECPPIDTLLPNGTHSGALTALSCRLTDLTPYIPYRLDLPVRGQLRIELAGNPADQFLTLRDSSGARLDSGASLARPIEAGAYTLLVHGRGVAQTGNFAINTAFTAEPGVLCAAFPNLGRRQTVDGQLPSSGCLAPDGTPFEAYTLTTDGAGTLSVSVESADFAPLIAVRSLDGRSLLPPTPGAVNVRLLGDSQYLIVITASGGGKGAYRIANSYQIAGDEACREVKSLAAADSDAGAIAASSCFVTIPGSGDQRYYNYYNFTLAEPGLVSATSTSGDFSTTLMLLDSAGNLLASDSGGGGFDPAFNVTSNLRARLPAGFYRLQLFSDLPSGGNYKLDFQVQAGPPQPCATSPLKLGDLYAALVNAPCRTSLGMSDVYTVTLPSAGTLELDMSSSLFDTNLAIRDTSDNLIVRAGQSAGLGASHLSADLPAGDYRVVAAAVSGAGVYFLTNKFTAHDIPPCSYVQSLDLNGGFIQRLGPRSCTGANSQPVDYYGFTLSADTLTLAVMSSGEVNGYLTLYDAAGHEIRSDDNSYGARDALIVQYLPAGAYKLAVRDATGTAGGLYQVDLRTTAGPRPPLCTPKTALRAGETASGVITYTGCQSAGRVFADIYQLTVPNDGSLDLRLTSSEFDAYLKLLDATGAVLDEDDDSGGNTNSRILRELAAGTYFLVVEPLGNYTAHGTYSLTTKLVTP